MFNLKFKKYFIKNQKITYKIARFNASFNQDKRLNLYSNVLILQKYKVKNIYKAASFENLLKQSKGIRERR